MACCNALLHVEKTRIAVRHVYVTSSCFASNVVRNFSNKYSANYTLVSKAPNCKIRGTTTPNNWSISSCV